MMMVKRARGFEEAQRYQWNKTELSAPVVRMRGVPESVRLLPLLSAGGLQSRVFSWLLSCHWRLHVTFAVEGLVLYRDLGGSY